MKVVILAGGLGSRLSEETEIKPKPMVEVGNYPILWHIMKIYSKYGFNDFIICLGYKAYMIKEYFANFLIHQSDVTIDLTSGYTKIHNNYSEPWKVTLVDTGTETMTGGRIKRIQKYTNNEPFMLTYGDGVSDVNIKELLKFHKKQKKHITMTAIQPEGRYGLLEITNNNLVKRFVEKPIGDGGWINGGFMVCEPEVFPYIDSDSMIFEKEPLEKLSCESQLSAYKHPGFWKCMDTIRDKAQLNELWDRGIAPWKIW